MQSTATSPLIRAAGAVALVGAALLPGAFAALPLTFNGAQQTLGALGSAAMPEGATASRGWGITLLTAAVLPFAAIPLSLIVARVRRLPRDGAVRVCATAVFACGLLACLVAIVCAAV
ncbi:hypothetical protein SZN_23611 [Streptomyces zinciresistens K42]|uniref:Uncharacterized protein n=1 Tax=Streptomyces zinciresistens K42 TaxID=700597 RepID=G2GGT8_9ACTN|nr:hypothetical protein [Streptomyces zinciresistens]EGX57284.1 hypothetical protein SZN_23611 [Streptomyces zinciresistens K42]